MQCGEGKTRTVDWECVMVTAVSERVSEGKTLASDRCGWGLRQGSVWKGVRGDYGLGKDDTG